MNARHVYRMVNQLCDAVNGIYYQAILTNIEHISDKCSDIAVYILEGENKDIFGNEHSYVHELHHSNNEEYLRRYQENYDRYFNLLNAVSITDPLEMPEEAPEASDDKSTRSSGKQRRIRKNKVKGKDTSRTPEE